MWLKEIAPLVIACLWLSACAPASHPGTTSAVPESSASEEITRMRVDLFDVTLRTDKSTYQAGEPVFFQAEMTYVGLPGEMTMESYYLGHPTPEPMDAAVLHHSDPLISIALCDRPSQSPNPAYGGLTKADVGLTSTFAHGASVRAEKTFEDLPPGKYWAVIYLEFRYDTSLVERSNQLDPVGRRNLQLFHPFAVVAAN